MSLKNIHYCLEAALFESYALGQEILDALELLQYREPTEIQEKVIPLILKGHNMIAKSKTGSGKTAAFAIPLCEMVSWDDNSPQALVLEPTRELACQVRDEIFHIGRKKRLKVPVVFGGIPMDKQALTLKQKSHIVVGTPGRILDHMRRGTLSVDMIKHLVIDEADLMLNMGFINDMEIIIERLLKRKQTLLFSATIGKELDLLCDKYLKDAVKIEIESETETVDSIEQTGFRIENEDKLNLLYKVLILENPDSCMIFCGTREMVEILYHKLTKEKIRCGMLHGLIDQKERLRTIDAYREGRFRYLIATDVAARGVDFDNVTLVIHYDFPTSKEAYVHRVGRTGRNGKCGKAISFINKDDCNMQSCVEGYTGVPITIMKDGITQRELEEKKQIFMKRQKEKPCLKQRKGAVFHKQIMKLCISGGRKSKLRAGDLVGAICSIEGITVEDIGIIDIRDSLSYVEILNEKGQNVLEGLQTCPIKGKVRKVQKTRQNY